MSGVIRNFLIAECVFCIGFFQDNEEIDIRYTGNEITACIASVCHDRKKIGTEGRL